MTCDTNDHTAVFSDVNCVPLGTADCTAIMGCLDAQIAWCNKLPPLCYGGCDKNPNSNTIAYKFAKACGVILKDRPKQIPPKLSSIIGKLACPDAPGYVPFDNTMNAAFCPQDDHEYDGEPHPSEGLGRWDVCAVLPPEAKPDRSFQIAKQ